MSLPAGDPGLAQFAPPLGEDGRRPALDLVDRGDVAQGAMQPDGVVVLYITADQVAGIRQGYGRPGSEAFPLNRLMPAFDLAVTLRVIGRCPDVGHARFPDKLVEIPGDKLGAVIGDDPRAVAGKTLPRALHDHFDGLFGHALAPPSGR